MEDLALHLHRVDARLEIGLHLVLVARVGVHHVPVARAAERIVGRGLGGGLGFAVRSGSGFATDSACGLVGRRASRPAQLTVALLGRRLEVLLVDDGLLGLGCFLHELLADLVGALLHGGRLDRRLGDHLVGDLLVRRLLRGCVEDRLLEPASATSCGADLDRAAPREALVEDLLGAGLGRGLDDIGLDDGFRDRLCGGLAGDLVHSAAASSHRSSGCLAVVSRSSMGSRPLGQENRPMMALENA